MTPDEVQASAETAAANAGNDAATSKSVGEAARAEAENENTKNKGEEQDTIDQVARALVFVGELLPKIKHIF